jgi:hypothetical protein
MAYGFSHRNQRFRIWPAPKKSNEESFSANEAQARFEAPLKGATNTSPKPLKDKPKVRKKTKKKPSK